jgi:hypothetical protein
MSRDMVPIYQVPGGISLPRPGMNSSQKSLEWIRPRTYRHPPIASRGNMNLHFAHRSSGVVAGR